MKEMKPVNQSVMMMKPFGDDYTDLAFRRKNKARRQTLANVIGIYFDAYWSVQVPSYLIFFSAQRLESIMASLWKPVKFIMKGGSTGDGGATAQLFWHSSGGDSTGGIQFLIFITFH